MRTSNIKHPVRTSLLIVVLLSVVFLPVYAKAQAVPDPFFSMDAKYVNAGQSFEVPINFGTDGAVRSISFDITYNPAVVHLDGVTEGTFLSNFAQAHGGATTFSPGSIDHAAGTASGVHISLSGAGGEGPVGAGVAAVIHFTALNVHQKSTTGIVNFHVLDPSGFDLAPYTFVTGGLVQVGAGPQIGITSLTAQPAGQGQDFGKQFKVSFTIANVNGVTSDPGTASLSIFGATPGFQQFPVPPIDPDQSLTIDVPGVFTLVGDVQIGDTADITLTVSGDGHRNITYTYQPVLDIENTNVDASVLPFIQITVPPLITWPDLQLGLNQAAGNINVRCNSDYEVDVADQNSTNWRLTEWDGFAFLSRKLSDPLHVISVSQGRDVSLGTPATLLTGTVLGQSPDDGQDFAVSFQQVRHINDAALTGSRSYHLVLTLNGYILY